MGSSRWDLLLLFGGRLPEIDEAHLLRALSDSGVSPLCDDPDVVDPALMACSIAAAAGGSEPNEGGEKPPGARPTLGKD